MSVARAGNIVHRAFGLWSLCALALALAPAADASQCYGSTAHGRLEHSATLDGAGYARPYSALGVAWGRTEVHASVAAVVSAAYRQLREQSPTVHYVYGESGWPTGGPFPPHRTHQNGLSVDFFVPVRNGRGQSVPLPTSALNRFGYDIEFDRQGRYRDLTIDFAAMAEHLYALQRAAQAAGIGIAQVIFDPVLLPRLYATPRGPALRQLHFMPRQAWVRHDEHYHVDFALPCADLARSPR